MSSLGCVGSGTVTEQKGPLERRSQEGKGKRLGRSGGEGGGAPKREGLFGKTLKTRK